MEDGFEWLTSCPLDQKNNEEMMADLPVDWMISFLYWNSQLEGSMSVSRRLNGN